MELTLCQKCFVRTGPAGRGGERPSRKKGSEVQNRKAYTHVRTHTDTRTHANTLTRTHAHTRGSQRYLAFASLSYHIGNAHTHTHTHTHTYTHTHTHTHIHTHTYLHKCTHALLSLTHTMASQGLSSYRLRDMNLSVCAFVQVCVCVYGCVCVCVFPMSYDITCMCNTTRSGRRERWQL